MQETDMSATAATASNRIAKKAGKRTILDIRASRAVPGRVATG
jgi:hypothetical protein